MQNRLWQSLDFGQLQALNMALHNATWAPSTPVEWQKYMNTSTHLEYIYDGSSWINSLDRTNHTGTQLASTISDFDTQVQTNQLDTLAAPTTSVDFNSQRITWVATPSAVDDASTKGYVDNLLNGTDWKDSVRCIIVTNITLSAHQTLDWILTVDGDRVLVAWQTLPAENGIYVAWTGAWIRALDADEDGELTAASCVFIEEGTTYADTQWRITTDWVIVIDTTDISWGQIWAGTTYTAWTGVDVTGSVISIDNTVVVEKYAVNIWDTTTTSFTLTHNLGTLDIEVQVREIATWELVMVPNKATTTTQCVIEFASAPSTDEYRVIVQA